MALAARPTVMKPVRLNCRDSEHHEHGNNCGDRCSVHVEITRALAARCTPDQFTQGTANGRAHKNRQDDAEKSAQQHPHDDRTKTQQNATNTGHDVALALVRQRSCVELILLLAHALRATIANRGLHCAFHADRLVALVTAQHRFTVGVIGAVKYRVGNLRVVHIFPIQARQCRLSLIIKGVQGDDMLKRATFFTFIVRQGSQGLQASFVVRLYCQGLPEQVDSFIFISRHGGGTSLFAKICSG